VLPIRCQSSIEPRRREIVPVNDTDHVTADALLQAHRNSRASVPGECFQPQTWNHISTALFEAFYANALYDVICPGDIYASEIGRLMKSSAFRVSVARRSTNVQPGAAPQLRPTKSSLNVSSEQSQRSFQITCPKETCRVGSCQWKPEVDYFKSETVSRRQRRPFLRDVSIPDACNPDDALYCSLYHTS
jgi:hypothetical protein